jgi:hypothetical protein
MIGGVKEAVAKFVATAEVQGAKVDISAVDYKALEDAINEEYECGADGSALDVINDLNDSVGLAEFGIKFIDD